LNLIGPEFGARGKGHGGRNYNLQEVAAVGIGLGGWLTLSASFVDVFSGEQLVGPVSKTRWANAMRSQIDEGEAGLTSVRLWKLPTRAFSVPIRRTNRNRPTPAIPASKALGKKKSRADHREADQHQYLSCSLC
jgi:hypothetical protein